MSLDSTRSPLAVLTKTAPGFISESNFEFTILNVDFVFGTWIVMKSEFLNRVWTESTVLAPVLFKSYSITGTVKVITFIPNALARIATYCATNPKPKQPNVLPKTPGCLTKSPFLHLPSFMSWTPSGILLLTDKMSPMTSSATAIAFIPGQFATWIFLLLAYLMSILSTPEPARIISLTDLLADSMTSDFIYW